ncbi:MAG: hypothetical protein BWY63_03760 [Chloroflexi bacterium ADurb.Bin360]|nr:MAG: hypothetical protein BWY63_03760 [Chloroflexi bacterium ADurb.Bin360]
MHDGQPQRNPRTAHHKQDEGNRLGCVAGEDIAQEFLDVEVDAPPLLHRTDDRGEVVIRQNHVGGFFRHICTAEAHSDTDIRLFERGGIIDPVTGHRHDMPHGLQGAHHA